MQIWLKFFLKISLLALIYFVWVASDVSLFQPRQKIILELTQIDVLIDNNCL